MQRDNEAKLQDDTVLFENDLCYPVPDVHRKRARKMSKDIARPITKRSRPIVDLPFSQWPSGKQKRAKGSNLRGKGGITKKQKYVNDILDKYTDSGKKNMKRSRGSPQSPFQSRKVEKDRNCTISTFL